MGRGKTQKKRLKRPDGRAINSKIREKTRKQKEKEVRVMTQMLYPLDNGGRTILTSFQGNGMIGGQAIREANHFQAQKEDQAREQDK